MARIVVVGNVASDDVVRLTERMREGAHLNGRRQCTRLGGGGANAAVALAAAGHAVTLVAAVGSDAAGAWQLDQLARAGVDTSQIVVVPGPSTTSLLHVDPWGERTIVNLGRVAEPEPPRRLLDLDADLVYVRTRATNLAPLLSAKGDKSLIVAHVPPLMSDVFPAHIILGSQSDLDDSFIADPLKAARSIAGRLLEWVVMTKGPGGAEALSVSGERVTVPAQMVTSIDSTGAGDAFAAGLCHSLTIGLSVADAVKVAVRWGTEKVKSDGSALEPQRVRALVDETALA